jgi:hypothetical protein
MNERVEELAHQSGLDSFYVPEWSPWAEEFEKFAELIVRECISINRQRMFSDYEGDSLRVAHNNALLCATSDMFEHFGIEE